MTIDEGLLYLDSDDVAAALSRIDVLAPVRAALVAYSRGEATLPHEAYLGWTAPDGAVARSICLPAGVPGANGGGRVLGVKVINSSLGNVRQGIPRASGLALLFDQETARVAAVMAAAKLSAVRTAAVSQLAIDACATSLESVAIIGTGALADAHLGLLLGDERVARITLFDRDESRARAIGDRLRPRQTSGGPRIEVAGSAEQAVRAGDVVITTTTATAGYIEFGWLRPGAVIVHVSLDDVLSEVVYNADWLVVDSWELVSDDSRRLLGRLAHEGLLVGPDGDLTGDARRRVDAELGDVLAGRKPSRRSDSGVVLVNPFGLGVSDVALAGAVHQVAVAEGLGTRLRR